MKRPSLTVARETQLGLRIIARLDSISDKLDDMNVLVQDLLRRIPPNETKTPLPSQIVGTGKKPVLEDSIKKIAPG